MELNSDLHCHPSLKGFSSDSQNCDMWTHYPPSDAISDLNKQIRKAIQAIARGSQTNLKACVDGKSRLLFVSIYPFERPFMQVCPQKPFRFLFKFLLPKRKHSTLGEAVLGIPKTEIQRRIDEAASDKGVDYFSEYLEELAYLTDPKNHQTDDPQYKDYRFHLARNYQEYHELIQDPKNLVGIFSVEGAHTFGNYAFANPFDKPFEQLDPQHQQIIESSFLENIGTVKSNTGERPVPFFITFSHHFNNLLAGHATSLSDRSPWIRFIKTFYTPGIRHLFDQRPSLELGISSLGRKVLNALLSKENGQRILIDTKHMSPLSRQEFYQMLSQEYAYDPIPIIHSHGAVSGWSTLEEVKSKPSGMELDRHSFFSRWGINLTNEDIEITFKSDGLIGLCLHEGRMPGYRFKHQKKKLGDDKEAIKDLYLKLFWSNIFHVAKIQLQTTSNIPNHSNWSGITIGSDYDGIVDPFDPFDTIADYPLLRQSMAEYVQTGKDILHIEDEAVMTPSEIEAIMNQKSLEEILEMLFYGNAHNFLFSHFKEGDLKSAIT
ncbi:MAG: hypothetical protein OER04_07880 [Cyclobacteriaceae bacterium]|nr:hypothetical protein [Cyclobacteriaceae bacterium]